MFMELFVFMILISFVDVDMMVQPPWKMPGRLAAARDLSGRNKQKKSAVGYLPRQFMGCDSITLDFLYCMNN